MPFQELIFEKIFVVAVTALRFNGCHPFLIRNKRWMFHISCVLGFKIFCFYLLCYSIFLHDIRKGNFTEACKNTAVLGISMNTTLKVFVLLYHKQTIKEMINILDCDYELAKQFSEDEKEIVYRYAKRGDIISKIWFLAFGSGSGIFAVTAVVSTALSFYNGKNELVPMFDFTFPDILERNKNFVSGYLIIFAICFGFAVVDTMMLTGFDSLIPIFTLHTCGKLDLLSGRIKKALSEAADVKEMEKNLNNIIIELQKLYRFVGSIQKTFIYMNEFNMKSTTMIISLIAFHVTEDFRQNKFNHDFFTLLIGVVLHFFIPCYFSDMLMEKSEEFRQAIYSCGWEKHPHKSVRQTVLFMLTRASRPLGISTVFQAVCLDTFANMVKQSYSIFSLMNAAWAK